MNAADYRLQRDTAIRADPCILALYVCCNGSCCRGHDDDWYQDRCIFCAQCKAAINSTYNKKGSRCQGCRRWFHDACRKQAAGTSKQQTPEALTATTTKAATAAAGATGIQHEQTERRTSRLFLHDDDCKQVISTLGNSCMTIRSRHI